MRGGPPLSARDGPPDARGPRVPTGLEHPQALSPPGAHGLRQQTFAERCDMIVRAAFYQFSGRTAPPNHCGLPQFEQVGHRS